MKSMIEGAVSSKEPQEDKLDDFGVPKIVVIGVGGAGCNCVNRIAHMGIQGAIGSH